MVGAVDRHADVVQQRAPGDDHLGVAVPHPVLGHHRRFDPALDQQAQQAQGDVENHLYVHPGVIRHSQALRGDLRHVPPGAHPLVGIDGLEEALKLAVAARRRVDLRLLHRLADRTGAHIWAF